MKRSPVRHRAFQYAGNGGPDDQPYLERLKLLLVPSPLGRTDHCHHAGGDVPVFLSIKLNPERGLSIALFPGRYHVNDDRTHVGHLGKKSGPKDAFLRVVAVCLPRALAISVMNNVYLVHLVFVFPELLLIVLGGQPVARRYRAIASPNCGVSMR